MTAAALARTSNAKLETSRAVRFDFPPGFRFHRSMNEESKLRETLRAWKVDAPAPAHFRANVWARIRERDAAAGQGFLAWLLAPFRGGASWRLATASALLLALAGVGFGTVSAATANERQRAEMERRYVQSVDPYLKVALTSAR